MATIVGLKKRVVDRTQLDERLCVRTGAHTSFKEEFGISYSQHNCEIFTHENQYDHW